MKNWYIVQTFSGFEQKVAEVLKESVKKKKVEDIHHFLLSTDLSFILELQTLRVKLNCHQAQKW